MLLKALTLLYVQVIVQVAAEITTEAVVELRWDFTDCGQSGRFGPTQEQCDEAYRGTNLADDVTVTNGLQTWTAPTTGLYLITARGSSGLASGKSKGGRGAITTANFHLHKGEQLNILVGQHSDYDSTAGSNRGPGGSGGTFITRISDGYILMVAGGGSSSAGSTGHVSHGRHGDANIHEDGMNASVIAGNIGKGGMQGFGGFRGDAGPKQMSSSGGGAGYYGNGNESYVKMGKLSDIEDPSPAVRFLLEEASDRTPGLGGSLKFFLGSVKENNGGFGGGGSGSFDGGAGGGGGYSGGGGGPWGGWGGGGGSVNNAETPHPTTLHSDIGSATISFTGAPCCGPLVLYVALTFIAGILLAVATMFGIYKCHKHRSLKAASGSYEVNKMRKN